MSSAAENNSEVAVESVKVAGDKEEVTPAAPTDDAKPEIKGTKRPAEVSVFGYSSQEAVLVVEQRQSAILNPSRPLFCEWIRSVCVCVSINIYICIRHLINGASAETSFPLGNDASRENLVVFQSCVVKYEKPAGFLFKESARHFRWENTKCIAFESHTEIVVFDDSVCSAMDVCVSCFFSNLLRFTKKRWLLAGRLGCSRHKFPVPGRLTSEGRLPRCSKH